MLTVVETRFQSDELEVIGSFIMVIMTLNIRRKFYDMSGWKGLGVVGAMGINASTGPCDSGKGLRTLKKVVRASVTKFVSLMDVGSSGLVDRRSLETFTNRCIAKSLVMLDTRFHWMDS